MLTHIHIKNFTIIENLAVDFLSGMTVLTGETGAGKSIIIDALSLALGDRADSKIIRQGAERCDITAIFDLQNNKEVQHWLKNNDFDSEEECILKRVMLPDGRSRATINGHAVPLQQLRELGSQLINIHGQHAHYSLMKRDEQRKLLDEYADHPTLLKEVSEIYHAWHHTKTQCNDIKTLNKDGSSRLELLQYQIQELDALGLSENEVVTLETEHKKLANAEHLLESCQTVLNIMADNEDTSALSLLTQAQLTLTPHVAIDKKITNATQLLNNAVIHVQETADEMRDFLDHFELNPVKLREIEQRLENIYDLARKHKVMPEALFAMHTQLKAELHTLTHASEHLEALHQQLAELEKRYLSAAEKLSKSRKLSAKKLSDLTITNLKKLGMSGCVFSITIESAVEISFSPQGIDHIDFMVSTNPGLPAGLLSKIASGGELSRIGLAIQVITSQKVKTPSLIFDEVDSGIGGKTAAIVGELLRHLSQTTQVICVTHLPQVAASAHHHLMIEKTTKNNITHTQAKFLDENEKTQEIARMLGGVKITQQTLATAKEMLESQT